MDSAVKPCHATFTLRPAVVLVGCGIRRGGGGVQLRDAAHTKDGDCTAQTGGRCLLLRDVKENFCGGACPVGNACLHPGGRCRYGQAATNGMCNLYNVLFCAYPSDPCGEPASPACPNNQICVPNADNQGRQCGAGPPMYP